MPKPTLELTAPESISSDKVVTINVKLLTDTYKPYRQSVEVRLEASAGYLSRSRLQLNDAGEGEFKIRADLLVPGDVIKVKAGFKNYTGVAETYLKVVE